MTYFVRYGCHKDVSFRNISIYLENTKRRLSVHFFCTIQRCLKDVPPETYCNS